jgi:16S rRNA (uracil1498-N3)-methyltransferase
VTTFYAERLAAGSIDLGEDAAHHARVKRLAAGDRISVTNGKGSVGVGEVRLLAKGELRVDIGEMRELPAPSPIHLYVPVADRDRMLWVAEKATELQVATWTPVMYDRSRSVSPRGEGEGFDRKVRARMIAALEQSNGAWLPEMRPVRAAADLVGEKGIVLERASRPLGPWAFLSPVRLAIGPEGGFTPGELSELLDGGWQAATLGDVTLRFETAAIGAVAVARANLS